MIAAILSTGTELTRGELLNSNATWLAAELAELGVEVTTIETVGDDADRISEAFGRLSLNHDAVICTGGLGPTTDDLTAESLARASNVSLEMHAASLLAITERLRRFGREMTASNAKQAMLPCGSRALPNANGTAPGFVIQLSRARVYCLPGVPTEMEAMFTDSVAPELSSAPQQPLVQVVLRTIGLAESGVNDALRDIAEHYAVTLGYRVHSPELAVKVVARRNSMGAANEAAQLAAGEIRRRLGPLAVFGEGNETLPEVLRSALVARAERLAIAESCTGGLASAILTAVPGASEVLTGSVVAYANEIKHEFLDVPSEMLELHGAVSEPTARAMATGIRLRCRSDWGLAITGIAGPSGASAGKPLGTVHFGAAGPNGVRHQHRVIRGDRPRVQQVAAHLALNWLRCLLDDPNADLV